MKNLEILNGKKLETTNKRESIGEKLDNSWRRSESPKIKTLNSKKLVVKLETTGKEKRKILLKLESGSSNLHSGNFNLISELLKGFFNTDES